MNTTNMVICEYPLPEKLPAWATTLQTKDLDGDLLYYVITEDGKLLLDGEMQDFHGALGMHVHNLVVATDNGFWVADGTGPDFHSYAITAQFAHGVVDNIEFTHNTQPALGEIGQREERKFAMGTHYILNDAGEPIEAGNLAVWLQWMASADRTIAVDHIGPAMVSTVFLGHNHQFEDGPPILFETLVFVPDQDGELHAVDNSMRRYETREQALAGHEQICTYLKGLK